MFKNWDSKNRDYKRSVNTFVSLIFLFISLGTALAQTPELVIRSGGAQENSGSVSVTVALKGTEHNGVTVLVSTSDSTATQPADYTATSQTLSWNKSKDGEQSFTIPLINDSADEGVELIKVSLSNATGTVVIVADSSFSVARILNDDVSWPSSWNEMLGADWAYMQDPTSDHNPASVDVINNAVPTCCYFTSDASKVYFRMALRGNPINSKGQLDQYAWMAEIDMDMDNNLDWNVRVGGITEFLSTYYYNPSETQNPSFYISDPVGSGMVRCTQSGTVYYLDIQVPFSALQVGGYAKNITASTPIKFFFHTSTTEAVDVKDATIPTTTISGGFALSGITTLGGENGSFGNVYDTRDSSPNSAGGTWTSGQTITVNGNGWPNSSSSYYASGVRNMRIKDSSDNIKWTGSVTTDANGDISSASTWTADYASSSGTYTIVVEDPKSSGSWLNYDQFTLTQITDPEFDLYQGTTAIADSGSYDFGSVMFGNTSDITFKIKNTGNEILTLTTPLSITGTNANQFSIQSNPLSSIAAGDSSTFTVRFEPTSTGSKTATISIPNNDSDENPYDLILTGTGAGQPTVTLAIANSPLAENGGVAYVKAILSNTWSSDVIVYLGYSGTASGSDYTAIDSILIAAGSLADSIAITGVNDVLDEDDESVIVDITSVTNGTESGTQQVTATITDDDAPPTVVLALKDSPFSENGGTGTVTAKLSAPSSKDVIVYLGFTGTASGSDYTASADSILIPAGSDSASITLTGQDDAIDESDETVIVDITSVTNGTESGTQQVTATITDDDAPPTVSLSLKDSPFSENGGTGTVTAKLSAPSSKNIIVYLGFSGTASGSDYTASADSILIPAGSDSASITLTGQDDAIDEDNETVIVDITSVTNGTESGTQQVTATITDDEGVPSVTLSLIDSPLAENGGVAYVKATLSGVSTSDVIVYLGYSGTASGSDYTAIDSILISAGSLADSIAITGVDDTLDENDETVITDITSVTNGTESGTQQVTATITDDDAPPTVSLSLKDSPFLENGGTGTVTAKLSAPSSKDIIVYLGFSGTASGSDYTTSADSILIPAGSDSASITLTGTDDAIDESDETVIVDITSVTNGTENGTQQVTATITDDEGVPSVTLSLIDSPLAENGGVAYVKATLSGVSISDVIVYLGYSGTASGSDYTAIDSIMISAGSLADSIAITGVDDTLDEDDESVIVDITSVTNGTESGTQQVTATITDDDNPPTVLLTLKDSPFSENGGTGTVTAKLSAPSSKDIIVYLGFSGTASGSDYTASADSILIPAGSDSASITLTGTDDAIDESDETVIVDITSVTNGTENGTQQVTATITDDEGVPSVVLSLIDSPLAEDGGIAYVKATLSGVSTSDVIVYLGYSGTASGSDYTAIDSILISAGSLADSIAITGVDDTLDEDDESVIVDITSVTNGTESGTQQVTATITDDDAPPTVSLSLKDSPFSENGGTGTVTAKLSAPSSKDIIVYLGFSGTASGSDYTASADSILIPAGSDSASITLTGTDDAIDESDETVIVDITSVTNGTENGTQQVTATITDDDAPPTVVLALKDSPFSENGGTGTVTAKLSAPSSKDVIVYLGFTGTASGSDYTASADSILIPAGSDSASITLTGQDDAIDESDETVIVDITSVTNGTESGTQQVTATITDDDTAGNFTVSSISGNTTEAGGQATFTVVLNTQPTADVTIPISTSDATEGTVSPASLTFTPLNWNIPQTITVTGVDDPVVDGDQHYSIILSAATSADLNYNGQDPADVEVVNIDDDTALTPGSFTFEGYVNHNPQDAAPGLHTEYKQNLAWSFVVENHSALTIDSLIITDSKFGILGKILNFAPSAKDSMTTTSIAVAGQYFTQSQVTLWKAGASITLVDSTYYFGVCSSVGDVLWVDTNKNKAFDSGERRLPNVKLILLDASGDTVQTIKTSRYGNYLFQNLTSADYTIDVDWGTLGSGYALTTGNLPLSFHLGLAEQKRDADFGFVATQGSVQSFVWNDLNKDGIRTSDEPGLPDITVIISDTLGNLVATTVSGANGAYQFSGIEPGIYYVAVRSIDEDMPENFYLTTHNNPTRIVITAGQSITDVSFGFAEKTEHTGVIGDFAWHDANWDRLFDNDETQMPYAKIYLYLKNLSSSATRTSNITMVASGQIAGYTLIDSVKSDFYGTYHFTQLAAGEYLVRANHFGPDPEGRYIVTSIETKTVILKDGEVYEDADFGFAFPAEAIPGTIEASVWNDTNQDRKRGMDEPPLAGVTVSLLRNSATIQSTETDGLGKVKFEDVPPGDYEVIADAPDRFELTTRNLPEALFLAAGADYLTEDFGFAETKSLGISRNRILAHYETWYGDSRHWSDPVTGGHAETSLAGLYDSRDLNILEYHMLQAYASGIDGFAVDWFGQNTYENTGLKELLDLADDYYTTYHDAGFHFEIAVSVNENSTSALDSSLTYLADSVMTQPAYWGTRRDVRRPVFFFDDEDSVFTPQSVRACADTTLPYDALLGWSEVSAEAAASMNLCYPWVKPSENIWREDGSDWGEAYLDTCYARMKTLPLSFGMGSVWPGFDDRMWAEGMNHYMNPQDTLVYGAAWQKVLDVENETSMPWCAIQSWNDFNRGTAIEPSEEFLYHYSVMTRDYARKFKAPVPADSVGTENAGLLVPKHILQARKTALAYPNLTEGIQSAIESALDLFFDHDYLEAISMLDDASGIRPPVVEVIAKTDTSITLSWKASPLADQYRIHFSQDSAAFEPAAFLPPDAILAGPDTAFTLSGLNAETDYFIAVTAMNSELGNWANESWYSSTINQAGTIHAKTLAGGTTAVDPALSALPKTFALDQNFPNPFNPETRIQYALPKAQHVRLNIYDIRGREVAVLVDGMQEAGYYSVEWNAQNMASGLYIFRIVTEEFTAVRKMMTLK